MKTYSKIVIAGALLASMSFAQQGDPFREERFKAKFGRYSQAEEARRKSVSEKAISEEKCADRECCRHQHAAQHPPASAVSARKEVTTNENQAFLDAWSKAKFGRVIRRVESPSVEKLAQSSPANSGTPVSQRCDRPTCCD
jgi:hypothetical protein